MLNNKINHRVVGEQRSNIRILPRQAVVLRLVLQVMLSYIVSIHIISYGFLWLEFSSSYLAEFTQRNRMRFFVFVVVPVGFMVLGASYLLMIDAETRLRSVFRKPNMPFALFLRSFRSENESASVVHGRSQWGLYEEAFKINTTFEQKLVAAAPTTLDVLGLTGPESVTQARTRHGMIPVASTDLGWKDSFKSLSSEAQIIFVLFDETESIEYELRESLRSHPSKVILMARAENFRKAKEILGRFAQEQVNYSENVLLQLKEKDDVYFVGMILDGRMIWKAAKGDNQFWTHINRCVSAKMLYIEDVSNENRVYISFKTLFEVLKIGIVLSTIFGGYFVAEVYFGSRWLSEFGSLLLDLTD